MYYCYYNRAKYVTTLELKIENYSGLYENKMI